MFRALSLLALALVACDAEPTVQADPAMPQGHPPMQAMEAAAFSGTVEETMEAGGYTYALLDTTAGEVWVAGPQTAGVAVGQPLSAPSGMLMTDFNSPTLDRTFAEIYFVSSLSPGAATNTNTTTTTTTTASPHAEVTGPGALHPEAAVETALEPVEGGHTVSQVVGQAGSLAGQEVVVRGKVVKYNANIMGTNWLHIQDGSGSAEAGDHDLTVTSDATTAEGEVVVVRGKVSTDRDFGMGYRYAVIIEGAELQSE